MSESLRMWVEISFNITYLVIVWSLVVLMLWRKPRVADQDRRAAGIVTAAFGLLALGDTGHVGFRVWAYAQGSLESTVSLFGRPVGLVGAGALATAVTVTLFYVLMLVLWRERFKQPYGPFEYFLFTAGLMRLALMVPAMNDWNAVVPPQPWSLIRNLPLVIQGLGVAYLFWRDATRVNDRTFRWIAIAILVSYACYLPVILFVQQIPMVGMLMIPKTMAYVAVALLAYADLYPSKQSSKKEAISLATD